MIEAVLKRLSEAADEAEIFSVKSKSTTIKTTRSEIESFKEKSTTGYGVRVIIGSKMGFYFTNKLDLTAAEKAVKIAGASQKDEFQGLAQQMKVKAEENTMSEIVMTVDEGIEMARQLVSPAGDYKELHATTGTVSWSTSKITVANTHGLWAEKSEFTLAAYLGTVATGVEQSTGFHYEVSREKDIDAYEVGDAACRLASDSLNPGPVDTGRTRVVLRPMAVSDLFENTLAPSFSADSVQRGRSMLGDQVGEEIFSKLDIVDDATLSGGLMTEPFDDEGVSAEKTRLVTKGVLKGFLYDTYTANKGGTVSTGNAGRASYAGLPGVSASNFIVSGSNKIEDEKGALIVHGLVGAHTANPISGDFSCETRNAFLNGKPVKKAIVSGNVFELLKSGVRFGTDVKQYSSIRSPSIELPDVMVVG
ncbi:MAG TPA: TldD/PmbA family protein [Euryarchaeota archaeon]|nr:peptidase PmbA [archaeon BMS3Abin16]HDH28446.1 TldD/PmbA family protein [Euryarchaeota archaeon]